jgi:hypothetical protein
MSNPFYCCCKVCINRTKEMCPTKLDLLIENLEKEIENKKKELESLKKQKIILNNFHFNYS